ncbi:MAG: hypothetical protein J3Q66DRAFT_350765 [Benniella sp.]|nr:MAG: hypothetical protein J3Q66DRAFT_350765 [Benniella sp.]
MSTTTIPHYLAVIGTLTTLSSLPSTLPCRSQSLRLSIPLLSNLCPAILFLTASILCVHSIQSFYRPYLSLFFFFFFFFHHCITSPS